MVYFCWKILIKLLLWWISLMMASKHCLSPSESLYVLCECLYILKGKIKNKIYRSENHDAAYWIRFKTFRKLVDTRRQIVIQRRTWYWTFIWINFEGCNALNWYHTAYSMLHTVCSILKPWNGALDGQFYFI